MIQLASAGVSNAFTIVVLRTFFLSEKLFFAVHLDYSARDGTVEIEDDVFSFN